MKYRLIIFIGIAVLMLVVQNDGIAQCAMCKATAESATENVNKGIGEGLNSGIVYLMMVPYLLLASLGFVFFRKKIVNFLKS